MKKKGKNYSCNNLGNRKKSDFYETPYSLTEQLLELEKLSGGILEPARGKGAISKVLKKHDREPVEYDAETDFLKETRTCDIIITNPPYSKAFQFIVKAKQVAQKKIIFLLPLSYLHGKKRFDYIWQDTDFPLARIYVFTRYPMLGDKLRKDGKYRTGMMVYAWYVWEKGFIGQPEINWIDNNNYVLTTPKKGKI